MNTQAPPPAPVLGAPPPPPQTDPYLYRNEHIIYRIADARGTYADQVNPMQAAMRTVGWNKGAGGDSIYLPFYQNHITSIRLTGAPAGVTFFWTDNLSGCRFFVDTIGGNANDIIVYHANTIQHTAGANAWADVQTPAASNVLNNLHTNAGNDGAYAGLVLNNVVALEMHDYFMAPATEERRKGTGLQGRNQPSIGAGAGRTRPSFSGACFICGFYNGAQWNFFFQTWGEVGYSRPGYVRGLVTFDWVGVHKRRTEGANVNASYATMGVMAHGPL
jgi:hypothetical protein